MIEVVLRHRAEFIPHDGMAKCPPIEFRPSPSVAGIQEVVAAFYGIDRKHMRSAARNRIYAWPRQVAMYLARELTFKSLTRIGELFGNRDHATAFYAFTAVEKRMAEYPAYRADVEALREALAA